ncbi:GIY-YIG nuclease family protein, partial [Francisella tularensis subsp. holarctica]|nr:GIY-YIG nuclease family protein [Francisella tularensis subsp. holarctica]
QKTLTTWQRQWKTDLINEFNPDWLDLYESNLD